MLMSWRLAKLKKSPSWARVRRSNKKRKWSSLHGREQANCEILGLPSHLEET